MKATIESVQQLLRRLAQTGDERAFEALFELFYPRLFTFSLNLIGSRESAEEIVSDVFVKLWNGRKAAASIQNLETYLYIATKNQSLNYCSRKNSHFTVLLKESGADMPVDVFSPEKEMELAELRLEVEAAINSLPTQCRMVFTLIREEGFSYREVAEILHVSVRTVETQLVRAIKKLNHALESTLSIAYRRA